MDPKKAKFLLDENIPVKLQSVFSKIGILCVTLKDKNWLGIQNGELSKKVKREKYVLVTRDKDFTYLWKKYKIQVIYIVIQPAILDTINPRMLDLLSHWEYDLSKPFLIMLQTDIIRFWQGSQ
jgi:predicted nuclease of predicted toxin-antitoxin system